MTGKNFSWLLILAAGILWGGMGIFVDILTGLGFTPMQAAFIRISTAAVMYVVFLAIKDKSLLKIKIKDIPMFLALGNVCILIMSCSYFNAIKQTSYSVAAILLYTSPVFVAVMSAIFFKERFGLSKVFALVIAFAGCVLVSGISGGEAVSPQGIALGLVSAVTYALYSIIGKFALMKYHPYTVSAYAFVFALIGAFIMCDVPGIVQKIPQVTSLSLFVVGGLLTGFMTAFLPFLLYTMGLNKTESGRAAIIASVEPLSATVCGLFKGQLLTVSSSMGILCIICAIVVINLFGKSKKQV